MMTTAGRGWRSGGTEGAEVWTITIGDLRLRRRQFVIAMVGASLVFAMALVLAGMSNSFREEVRTTVGDVGADRWVVTAGSSGPITGFSALPPGTDDQLVHTPGVRAADPLIVIPQAAQTGDGLHSVYVIAYRPNGLGTPTTAKGRVVQAPGEAVADGRLGVDVGEVMTMSGRSFTVVGTTTGHSVFGGLPIVYVDLADGQALSFGGQPLATALALRGVPEVVPSGVSLLSNSAVRSDALRTMHSAVKSIDSTQLLMWIVAAVIVAGLVYVSALERGKDFAVLKAMGASTGNVFASMALEAVLVCLVAVIFAGVIATLIRPFFALPVAIPFAAFVTLPVIALAVGLVGSLAGLRRAVTADPARAFGST
jgi:putative ABC transport system permease protein